MINSAIGQGLVYGVLAMGVLISYKILDFPDLTVDGSFPLGGVVFAVVVTQGHNPWMGLLLATIFGFIAGCVTGLLHTRLKITGLLSGILTMTALYSINLVIGGFKPNIPMYGQGSDVMRSLWGCIIIAVFIKVSLDILLKTKFGYLLKVTGDNENLVPALGHSLGVVKVIGLGISNALAALAGALISNYSGLYDISSGSGMVVMGLSAVILGMSLLSRTKLLLTTQVIVGSIIYRFIVAIALNQGLHPQLLKLVTVAIFLVSLGLGKWMEKYKRRASC